MVRDVVGVGDFAAAPVAGRGVPNAKVEGLALAGYEVGVAVRAAGQGHARTFGGLSFGAVARERCGC